MLKQLGCKTGNIMLFIRGLKKTGSLYATRLPLFVSVLFLSGAFLLVRSDIFVRQGEQHFTFLAQSILKGHFYFVEEPGRWGDTSLYQDNHYWPSGPLPALLFVPLVALFGRALQQGYPLLVINLATLYLLYRIALRITANYRTSLWLSFAYVFSTAYLYIALKPWSWYFAQAVATLFVLLGLHEFLYKKRWWLIGTYLAFAVATRVNLVLAGLFFAASILLEKNSAPDLFCWNKKCRRLFQLALPIAISLSFLLGYNYLRFGNVFEFGYRYQLLYNEPAVNREHGLWSLVHFPANLYYFLLKGPEAVFLPDSTIATYPFFQANIWGMSILFTSPILLWGLRAPMKEMVVYLSLATSLIMLSVLLGYYGIGVRQYGYRYALDFYPFLFLMLAYASRAGLTLPMQVIIVLSFILNSYLIHFV